MALNPGIILQGQTPDLLGTIDRSNTAAFNQRQNQQTNALQSYVQENGAGILNNDPNALAGYAGFDPAGAINMRGANEARQQGIEAAKAAAQQHAAQISAAEAAAEAEQYNKAIAIMSGIQSPEQWDAAAQQFGLPDLAGQFDNRETIMLATRDTADIYAHYAQQNAAPETYSMLTPEQVQASGLDPAKQWQRSPDGKITQVGGGGTNVTVNNGPDANRFNEKAADALVTEASDLVEAGNNAQRNIARIDTMEGLLKSSPQGLAGVAIGLAGSLGIPVEGADSVQALEAIISQMVPEQRAPGSGTMSDADLALFKRSLPQLINTPAGNQKIVDIMRGIAMYDIEMGRIARQALYGQITPQEAGAQYAQVENPLAGFMASDVSPATLPPVSGPMPITDDDQALFDKYKVE